MKIHGAPTTILVYRVSRDRVDRVTFKTYVKNVLPNEWIFELAPPRTDAEAEPGTSPQP